MQGSLLASKLQANLTTFFILIDRFASSCSTTACMLRSLSLFEAILVALITVCEWRLWTLKISEFIFRCTRRSCTYAVGCTLGLIWLSIVWSCRIDLLEYCITSCIWLNVEFHIVLITFYTTHNTNCTISKLKIHLLFLINYHDTTLCHSALVVLIS